MQIPVSRWSRSHVPDRRIIWDLQLGDVDADAPVHGSGVLPRLTIRVVDGHTMPTLQELRIRLARLLSKSGVRLEVVVGGIFGRDTAKEDAGQR